MTTNNITATKRSIGTKKIEPVMILNLTPASEEIAVVLKVTRAEGGGNVLDAIKREKLASPWREDDLAKAYMSKEVKATKLRDPVATLRKVNELLSRG